MGNKRDKHLTKTPEQELKDDEIELLQANTYMDINKTINFNKGFFEVYFIIFKIFFP